MLIAWHDSKIGLKRVIQIFRRKIILSGEIMLKRKEDKIDKTLHYIPSNGLSWLLVDHDRKLNSSPRKQTKIQYRK